MAVDRLLVKLGRVVVPPYLRVEDGSVENVSGYTYNRKPGITVKALTKVQKAAHPEAPPGHPLAGYGITYFESKTCPRCGGSGEYSYNSMHGSVCYQCNGAGRILTKKGHEGYDAYAEIVDKRRYPAPSDLKPGEMVTWPPNERPQKWATVVGTEKQPNGYVKVTATKGGKTLDSTLPDNPQKPFLGPGFRRRTTAADLPNKSTFPGYVGFHPEGWHLGKWYEAPEVVEQRTKERAAREKAAKAAAEAARIAAEEEAKKPPPPPEPPEDFAVVLDGEQGVHVRLNDELWSPVDIMGTRLWIRDDRRQTADPALGDSLDAGLKAFRDKGEPTAMEQMLPLLRAGKLGDDALDNPGLVPAAITALRLRGQSAQWSDFIQSMREALWRSGSLTPKQARGVLNTFRKQLIKQLDTLKPIEAATA